MTDREMSRLVELGCKVDEAYHCIDDDAWNKKEISFMGYLVGSELVSFGDVTREMEKVVNKMYGDYMKKRVAVLVGYTPSPSRKGHYTFLVKGVDNCVNEFTDMNRSQMATLWRAFEADSYITAYTMNQY